MAEEETKMVEVVETHAQQPETPPQQMPAPVAETAQELPEEKSVAAPAPTEETTLNSEPTLASTKNAQLSRVETQKRLSLIKAWEENEKCKVENKAQKNIVAIEVWENTKKAVVEAELRKFEENLEKKKAEYTEKMKNKVAMIHKEAEERKAIVEAKRGEDFLKLEEIATQCHATGKLPRKFLGLF